MEEVGLIGFCFGGWIVYLGVSLFIVKVMVFFYGVGIFYWVLGIVELFIIYIDKI